MNRCIVFFVVTILLACQSQNKSEEILIFNQIVEEYFNETPIYDKFLRLEYFDDLVFHDEKSPNMDTNDFLKRVEPKVPDFHKNIKTYNFTQGLINNLKRNNQLNELSFLSLKKELSLINAYSSKIELENTRSESLKDFLESKTIDNFQEFGYPILCGDLIIIYRIHYAGIKTNDSLGLIGNGTFYVFRKENLKWKLINKITKWIT